MKARVSQKVYFVTKPSWLLFGVISFVLLSGLVYLASTPRQTQTSHQSKVSDGGNFTNAPSITSTQTERKSDWMTHTDTELGFSIKYPTLWNVYPNRTKGLGYSFQSPDLEVGHGGVKNGEYMRVVTWRKDQHPITRNSPNVSLQDWFLEFSKTSSEVILLSDPTYTNVSSYPTLFFDRDIAVFGKAHTAVIFGSDRVFMFDFFYSENGKAASIGDFERMLSTLMIFP